MEPEIGVYEAMRTLRAVRRLRPDPVPDQVLRRVLDAACQAPTGANVQPWRVVLVRERASMAALGRWYAEGWFGYADGHRKLLEKLPEPVRRQHEKMLASGDYLARHFADTPACAVFCFNPKLMTVTDAGQDRLSVVGGASVYTAVENLLLACRAEGLGCVLTTLLCAYEPQVRELLAIPDPWYTAAAIPMGWPVLRGHGPVSRRPPEKLTFADRWDNAWLPAPDDAGEGAG
jgi:nitroreductase